MYLRKVQLIWSKYASRGCSLYCCKSAAAAMCCWMSGPNIGEYRPNIGQHRLVWTGHIYPDRFHLDDSPISGFPWRVERQRKDWTMSCYNVSYRTKREIYWGVRSSEVAFPTYSNTEISGLWRCWLSPENQQQEVKRNYRLLIYKWRVGRKYLLNFVYVLGKVFSL